MNIYKNPSQRIDYVNKSCLNLDYKQRIRDSLRPGKDSDAMVLTEEFSIITFRKVFRFNNALNYDMEVGINGYNPKNLIISQVKPSSRDWAEQKMVISINKRLIRFRVATAEKLFNPSSVLSQIDFKMRKLLLKV